MNPSNQPSTEETSRHATGMESTNFPTDPPSITTETNDKSSIEHMQTALPDHSLLDNDKNGDDEGEDEGTPKEATDEESKEKDKDGDGSRAELATLTAPAAVGQLNSYAKEPVPLMEMFVQQATRVQSMLMTALEPPNWMKRPRIQNDDDKTDQERSPQRRRLVESEGLAAQLARQKTTEVLTLQHQLQSLETEVSTLKMTNESLRNETTMSQQRYERTAEGLRLAQRNASQARTDADAAETTAANLAQTLKALQTVVRDTQESMDHLKSAHDEIQQKSTSLQAELWQKEVRIACMEKEYNTLAKDYQNLEQAQTTWKEGKAQYHIMLDEKERKIGSYQRQLQERRNIDEARAQRVQRLEEEWRQAQALLVEATAAQSAGADTQSQLQSDLRNLQQKNKDLHDDLMQTQQKSRQESERHHEALQQAEKEGQQWLIQLETSQDQNERLRNEKSSLEKQISKLKGQLANKTTSASESQSLVSPEPGKAPHSDIHRATNQMVEATSLDKENSTNSVRRASFVPPGGCVICGKASFGVMKKCQCGNSCNHRAHLSCAQRLRHAPAAGLSVAHPGTPALRAPFVLCTLASADSTNPGA